MNNNLNNAGKYNKKIKIYSVIEKEDNAGYKVNEETLVLETYSQVKTTRGFALITNNSDFEKAYTNFTIRYPRKVVITRDMIIKFNNKKYTIEYLNDIDERHVELEIQAKEVTK